MKLTEILKDSNYKLTQFDHDDQNKIKRLEESIFLEEVRGKDAPHVICIRRNKKVRLTPEEVIRQLYLMVLTEDLGYILDRIELEYAVSFGREKKRADIVIFDKDKTTSPYIIVEV